MSGKLHIEREADVVSIILDHAPANVLTSAMRRHLAAELDSIEADLSVRAVVLRGAGKNFCTGADLSEEGEDGQAGKRPDDLLPIFRRLETLRPPVIAAIGGWCVGAGLELALCADLRIASEEARFMCAGVNVGMLAHAYRLPRTIGSAGAKQMLYTGSPVDAAKALSLGLVGEVVSRADLDARAEELGARIASRAPLAVEASKRMANAAFDLSPDEAADLLERELAPLFDSADHREAVTAFREKRDPRFERR